MTDKWDDTVRHGLSNGATAVGNTLDRAAKQLPDGDTVRATLKNPIALSVGLLAGGVILGLVVPLTDFERRRLKPIGDDLARRASEARTEIADQGKSVVAETVAAAQDSFQKHRHELAESLGVATAPESTRATTA